MQDNTSHLPTDKQLAEMQQFLQQNKVHVDPATGLATPKSPEHKNAQLNEKENKNGK